jgi:sterol 3beta-glucosyltransferase
VADVLLLAVDSWGGVAGMITLGGSLRDLGVNARVASYSDFGDKVRAAGCEFIDLGVSLADWWAEQNAQRPGWARNPVRTTVALRSGGKAQARAATARLGDSVEPGEGIVSGPLSLGSAAAMAALHHSRFAALNPSRLPQATLTPLLRRPSRLNEWSGRFALRGSEWILRPAVNAGRETLGLPPWTARDYLNAVNQTTTVYGVSPALMPRDPAWPAHITVAGHLLRPDSDPVIPEGLPEFLAEHPGAIYIGFGSWGSAVRQSDLDMACRALAIAGRPGVIAAPGERGLLSATSTPVFAVGEVSHDWLFPRLAAVVHHGGSGTTHRAVLAGVPSMAVPISFDQPYWGRRLEELGVGAPPIPYRKLSPVRLASAIKQMTGNPEMTVRAKQLSAVLTAEHGPAAAARAIVAALAI